MLWHKKNSGFFAALDTLGYNDFRKDAEEVMNECRDVAAKRRRQSTRLENLVNFFSGTIIVNILYRNPGPIKNVLGQG